jgi:quercetin dioxygenase-like cupin family protein
VGEATQGNEATAWPRRPARRGWHYTSFAAGFLLASAIAAWMSVGSAPLRADTAPYTSSDIFHGNHTIIDQTIAYPNGTPMVNALIVPLAPGEKSAWHTHATPLFGYILEGELTVDYGSKGTRVYHTGEAVLEAVDWPHQASNRGTVLTRVLAVNIGVEGGAFAALAAGPK